MFKVSLHYVLVLLNAFLVINLPLESLLWYNVWEEAGCPSSGVLSNIKVCKEKIRI